MASICTDRGGLRRISFVDAQGRRRSLRLGRMSKKDVEWMLPRVEALIDCTKSTRPPSPELLKWIAELPPKTQQKLKALGLIDAASMTVTLGELVEKFMALQDVKPATLAAYRQTTGSLMDVLGKGTPIVKITTADADRWRKAQASSGLAGATVAKRTIVAKNIFNRAVHWKMISSNPFAHLKSGNQRNPDRIHYVDKAAIDALLEVCPDNQWKAIIALARYAGLRCPSEIVKLRWEDVDWQKRALTVRSPKTERHVGHEVRVVPIDQVNLRGILAALYEESSGKGPVIPRLQRGFTGCYMGLQRLVEAAGLERWPRLVQNLRASCAIDWAQSNPGKDAAEWAGHSLAVAMAHYLSASDRNFQAVAGTDDWTPPVPRGTENGVHGADEAE